MHVSELGFEGGRREREAGSPPLCWGSSHVWGRLGSTGGIAESKEAGAGLRPRGWDPAVGGRGASV